MFAIQIERPALWIVPRAEPQPRPTPLLPAPHVAGLLPYRVPPCSAMRVAWFWALVAWCEQALALDKACEPLYRHIRDSLPYDYQMPLSQGHWLLYPAFGEQHTVPRLVLRDNQGRKVRAWQIKSPAATDSALRYAAKALHVRGLQPVGEAIFMYDYAWDQATLFEAV